MNDQVTTDKLVSDLRVVIADAEELLRATASTAGEKVSAARMKMEDSVRAAKVKLTKAQDAMVDQAHAAALATDDYVHAHPWQAVGFAAAAGVVLGMLISRR